MSHIETWIRSQRREPGQRAFLSVITDIPKPRDLVSWVAAARKNGEDAFYWQKPNHAFTIAAVGSCWECSADGQGRFRDIIEQLAELNNGLSVESSSEWLTHPILAGGFSFNDGAPSSDVWRGFPAARMTLPKVAVVGRDGRYALVRNAEIREDSDLEALAAQLVDDTIPAYRRTASASGRSPICDADTTPAADSWTADVQATIDMIQRNEIEKLVLARSLHLHSDGDFDLASVLERLRSTQPECTIFSFPGGAADFVGATPETLVSIKNQSLHTLALAGTIKRGATKDTDSELRRSLEESDKDRSEHDIVVRGITDDLLPLCDDLEVGEEPEVLGLHDVQHLRTPIHGHVRPGNHILSVVEALHPSPAVGGYPKQGALERLEVQERFERGWYAAPIGWIDTQGNGEMAVGLRSGVLRGKDAHTFAGAGIVASSDPAQELAETDLKLGSMLAALTDRE